MDGSELGGFLRSRRARVRPADAGFADGGRRRTPGLRRAEVALLAGISVDYYVRLEQGRGPRPSAQVLTALGRALRLTADERDYLLRLGAPPPPERAAAGPTSPRPCGGSSTGSTTSPPSPSTPATTWSPGTRCSSR
ncbi:helix-turn-helix domain-containing protein [Actinomadura atramentaria]|uniref:helix-turn-helix domain-containing protein n=1 Tax=Actinomadura atramentaria TaxID=1990 RepID=UPI00039DAE89|nr:helix-turn-helix transcriptional regulator [Actinomadura atramentaria]